MIHLNPINSRDDVKLLFKLKFVMLFNQYSVEETAELLFYKSNYLYQVMSGRFKVTDKFRNIVNLKLREVADAEILHMADMAAEVWTNRQYKKLENAYLE